MTDPHPELTRTMHDYAERAHKELKYFPHQFLDMLREQFGYETAVALAQGSKPSYGFFKLAELGHLELTVEALIIQPRWYPLFGRDVLLSAHRRLSQFEYRFPGDGWSPDLESSPVEEIPAPRTPVTVDRTIRDGPLAAEVKSIHDYRCQMCRMQIVLPGNRPYAEAHHIRPLGAPHNGPDEKANMMCVCPTCHVLLDYAAVPLDFDELNSAAEHQVRRDHVAHHNQRYRASPPPNPSTKPSIKS